jgi:hypothetical protein
MTTTTTPRRLRFNRFDGKPLPDGAKLVTRGTRWGNRHRIAEKTRAEHQRVVDLHRQDLRDDPALVADVRRHLAGHDLACTCPLDWPCHADTLLIIANGGTW